MDMRTVIPPLFYDVIGRVVPGFTLLMTGLIVWKVPHSGGNGADVDQGITWLLDWFAVGQYSTVRLMLGVLVVSYILAFVLHGVLMLLAFILHRVLRVFDYPKALWKEKTLASPRKTVNDELTKTVIADINRIDQSSRILQEGYEFPGVPVMYDSIKMKEPSIGTRLEKMKAEIRMCDTIATGWIILFTANLLNFYLGRCEGAWVLGITLLLGFAAMVFVRYQILKRYLWCLCNHWILLFVIPERMGFPFKDITPRKDGSGGASA